ncbi:MAG TPA: MFS transporter [Burkholderiales bacterium]|nr:MFS transporter [Burkholderiales bacterium]
MSAQQRPFMALAVASSAVIAVAFGLRNCLGLFISPINSHTALGYATISFAFAVMQLMWGVAQPLAGAMTERWGARPVLLGGALLLSAATALIPFATTTWALVAVLGIAFACGAGTAGPAVLASAISRWIPEAKRSVANGMITAGGSFGTFIIVPLAQLFISVSGGQVALVILGAISLLSVPLVLYVTSGSSVPHAAHAEGASLKQAIADAYRDPSYLLLTAGFFTCGFHIAFIATHLPGVVALCLLPPTVSAWSLSIIGLFNIFGALWIGRHIQANRMKVALSGLYFSRALLIVAFFFSPKTPLVFFIFSAGIGFTYLSTVPPTIGLVAKLHGPRYLATLFGLVMLSHQVGGFLGAWLGGRAFEATGSYDWMWYADAALCLFAAAVHLPIREAQPRLAAAAA